MSKSFKGGTLDFTVWISLDVLDAQLLDLKTAVAERPLQFCCDFRFCLGLRRTDDGFYIGSGNNVSASAA